MQNTSNHDSGDYFRRLFEQSFLVLSLTLGVIFLFKEYKVIFSKLDEINKSDETELINKVKELTNENKHLYERLIDCNNGTND